MSGSRIFSLLLMLTSLVIEGCAVLPDNSGNTPGFAITDTQDTWLAKQFRGRNPAPQTQSALLLLGNGLDAFVARAVLAQVAEKSIDVQYYMIHDDHVGTLFADQLLQAADRGVRVRVLLDDIDEGRRDLNLALFDAHPNIEVRIFNPFGRNVHRIWQYATGFGRQTRRAHNKSFTVDNQATILGGRNIGDEYFSRDPELAFQDLDILAIGPAARQVSRSFDEYWNHRLSYPVALLLGKHLEPRDYAKARADFAKKVKRLSDSVYLERLKQSRLAQDLRNQAASWVFATAKVYADPADKLFHPPGDTHYQMLPRLLPYLENARAELIMLSPYFVPGKQGVAFLLALRKRGVRVRILTNSLASTDVAIVHAGYARYREALLRGGVELYELNRLTSDEERKARKKGLIGSSKSSLHAKAFTVDRKAVFVGSLNLDPRSISQNTEIGMIVESPALGQKMAQDFDRYIDDVAFRLELEKSQSGAEHLVWYGHIDGQSVRYEHEPLTGFWQRLSISLLKWLPIESQI